MKLITHINAEASLTVSTWVNCEGSSIIQHRALLSAYSRCTVTMNTTPYCCSRLVPLWALSHGTHHKICILNTEAPLTNWSHLTEWSRLWALSNDCFIYTGYLIKKEYYNNNHTLTLWTLLHSSVFQTNPHCCLIYMQPTIQSYIFLLWKMWSSATPHQTAIECRCSRLSICAPVLFP